MLCLRPHFSPPKLYFFIIIPRVGDFSFYQEESTSSDLVLSSIFPDVFSVLFEGRVAQRHELVDWRAGGSRYRESGSSRLEMFSGWSEQENSMSRQEKAEMECNQMTLADRREESKQLLNTVLNSLHGAHSKDKKNAEKKKSWTLLSRHFGSYIITRNVCPESNHEETSRQSQTVGQSSHLIISIMKDQKKKKSRALVLE